MSNVFQRCIFSKIKLNKIHKLELLEYSATQVHLFMAHHVNKFNHTKKIWTLKHQDFGHMIHMQKKGVLANSSINVKMYILTSLQLPITRYY